SHHANLTLTEVLHAPKVVEMVKQKKSREVIARALDITVCTVNYAYAFGEKGVRPKSQPARKRTGKGSIPKYQLIADEVVRLRHDEMMPFCTIAEKLKAGQATVRRADDYKCPQAVLLACQKGKRP